MHRSRCDDVQEILGAICGVHGGKMWNSDEPRAPSFILSSNRDDISSTSQRPIHQSWLSAYMSSRALATTTTSSNSAKAELCDRCCLSVCEHDNSRTPLQMSTKHGRHGQWVIL